MKVQQHWAMSKLIGEEMALIDGIDADQQIWMKTLTKVHEERVKLEEEILEKKQEEVLQGYTVSNQEVRNNWEDWKAPIDKELSTLLENGAISPITKQQRDELVQQRHQDGAHPFKDRCCGEGRWKEKGEVGGLWKLCHNRSHHG